MKSIRPNNLNLPARFSLFTLLFMMCLAAALVLVPGGQATLARPAAEPRGGAPQAALGTGFTYQGQLKDGGNPANGQYDLQFTLYDALTGGTQVGTTQTVTGQTVSEGLFTVQLDFGANAFGGDALWLEIAVRPAGGGTYTTLSPRQPLTAVPYAMSLATGSAGAVVSGTVAGPALVVTNTDTSNSGTAVFGSGTIGLYGSGTWRGVRGETTNGVGVFGNGSSGTGVMGVSSSWTGVYGTSGSGTGVIGNSYSGYGVSGYSNVNDGVYGFGTTGVRGEGAGGNGVWGTSSSGYGVRGDSTASGGFGVFGSASGSGMYGYSQTGTGVTGYSVSGTHGVYGQADASNGIGVHGAAGGIGVKGETGSGTGYGVYGVNTSATGYGVFGENNNGTNARGVVGSSSSGTGVYGSSTSGTGVYGRSSGTGAAAGVFGVNDDSTGIGVVGSSSAGIGVKGQTDTGSGLWGVGFSSGYGLTALQLTSNIGTRAIYADGGQRAAEFNGDVIVDGWLYKSGGSFRIDDPLDPENEYLLHSFVESPDMMNVYNGNVTTDDKGGATVALPDYFEALNKDFRYQLTPVGQFAQAMVASEVKNNSFTIKTDKPNVKVSWQVTGIRKDPYALAHPMGVEVPKPEEERGTYLYPEGYGQPASKGVNYERNQQLRNEALDSQGQKP